MPNSKDELSFRLMNAFWRFKKANIQEMTKCCLTPSQVGILHFISFGHGSPDEGISISQLCESSMQTASSVTQILNILEKEELVERSIDLEDRRVIRVRMTAKGKAIVEEHHRKVLEMSNGFIEHIGEEKITTFVSILEEIISYKERIRKID